MMSLLLSMIMFYEGCAKCEKDGLVYPYLCPTGYPTQGYGIRVANLKVPPITKAEAERRLKLVVPIYINEALKYSPNLVNKPNSLAAIASFIYNLGPANYAGSTLRKRVNEGNWEAAKREIVKWKHGRVNGNLVVLNGLLKRRQHEATLLGT